VLLSRPPLAAPQDCPSDLHVLGTPPAFVLSQDQTLHHCAHRAHRRDATTAHANPPHHSSPVNPHTTPRQRGIYGWCRVVCGGRGWAGAVGPGGGGGGGGGPSALRTAALRRLPAVHGRPINLVVFQGPYPLRGGGGPHLGEGFALRCLQRFSRPDVGYAAVPLAGQPLHRRSVRPGPLVLGTAPRKPPAPAADRDRTVSRRSEPSSRAAFMGEQPNPWDRLRPQDATSRHRGAKPRRRCGLSGGISLLSPG
jgi:hypothetical protein